MLQVNKVIVVFIVAVGRCTHKSIGTFIGGEEYGCLFDKKCTKVLLILCIFLNDIFFSEFIW